MSESSLNTNSTSISNKSGAVLLHLKPVGEAAALRNSKFRIDGDKTLLDVEKFLAKQLKHDGAIVIF